MYINFWVNLTKLGKLFFFTLKRYLFKLNQIQKDEEISLKINVFMYIIFFYCTYNSLVWKCNTFIFMMFISEVCMRKFGTYMHSMQY